MRLLCSTGHLASLQASMTDRDETGVRRPLGLQQARNLHLSAQGLLHPPRARATRRRLLAAIERMQLLQIDTIHVVARSPYLVLFTRLGAYPPRWLDEALAKGSIFECWAHEACFAPMSAHALLRHGANPREHHWAQRHAQRMHRDHRAGMDRLLAHVRDNGAVRAADFDRPRHDKGNGWWGWKDEKRWLEALFALGDLMIARRENFQRVYDLSERVLARSGLTLPPAPDAATIRREHALRAAHALGIAQARWLADYFRSGKRYTDAELDTWVDSGDLLRVPVRGWDVPAYVHREHAALLGRAGRGLLKATCTTLLSPFDPVVWDRARASAMFGFDYTLECYTPAPKRRHGYFVLPILRRGRLVGRLDAKAHRGEGTFEVKALYLEPATHIDDALLADVASALQSCADWHGTPRVQIRRCEPSSLTRPLRAALREARAARDALGAAPKRGEAVAQRNPLRS
jgi:uncharacterized protein YcaQ